MSQYASLFLENGWDRISAVCTMTEEDIKDIISKPGHVRQMTIAIDGLKKVLPHTTTPNRFNENMFNEDLIKQGY